LHGSAPVNVRFFLDPSVSHPAVIFEIGGKRILIDPGVDSDPKKSLHYISQYNPENLDAILITHFHGDHSALVLKILESGRFKGKIVFHNATAAIMRVYFNGFDQYSRQFVTLKYGEHKNLFGSVWITLLNAGHVLGSSIFSLMSKDKHVVVTGDLGAKSLPLVQEPDKDFFPIPIDLCIADAKQIGKAKVIDGNDYPLGDILFFKIKDCFMFDQGSILIYAPLVQIPPLLYCLNYIFENPKFQGIQEKIDAVFLDPQQKLLELIEVFENFTHLLDTSEKEHVPFDKSHFNFDKLKKHLPENKTSHRKSIIITPNRNVFGKYFRQLKQSEENDVLLLNNNIHYALKDSSKQIDKLCNIQIKRIPFLHYHPDLEELAGFCKHIREKVGVKKFVLYHYKDRKRIKKFHKGIKEKIGGKVDLVHELNNGKICV